MPGAKPGVKLVFPGREKPGEAGSKAGDAGSKPGKAGNPGAGPKAGTPGISGSLVRAAHSMLLGREVPAGGPAAGMTARDAEKKAIVAALSRIAKERWTAHVRDKEAEGAGFYSGAPVPGTSGGVRANPPDNPGGPDIRTDPDGPG